MHKVESRAKDYEAGRLRSALLTQGCKRFLVKAEKGRREELNDRLKDLWSGKDKTGCRPKGTAIGFIN